MKSVEHVEQLSANQFESIEKLIVLFKKGNEDVRVAVLNRISDEFSPDKFISHYYPIKEVIEIFLVSLNSDSEDEQTEALCCLPEINADLARESALNLLTHSSECVREEALCILGYVGKDEEELLLHKYINFDDNEVLSIAAFISLLRLGYKKYYYMCENIIKAASEEVLCELLTGLCSQVEQYDFNNIIPLLEKRVLDYDSEKLASELEDFKFYIEKFVRKTEIIALDLGNNTDVERLLSFFEHQDKDVRFAAVSRFGAGVKPKKNLMNSKPPSESVFDYIKKMINDTDDEIRSEVLSILGDWKRNQDIEFIVQNIEDNSELVRIDAMYALGDVGDKIALKYIDNYLNNQRSTLEKVRYFNTLLRLDKGEYFEEWLSFLSNNNALIRENIAGSIWSIVTPDRVLQLIKVLEQAKKKESYVFVYNEINDALSKLSSYNENIG